MEALARLLTRLGVFTARPAAFLVAIGYLGLWLLLSPGTLNWPGVAGMMTLFMALLIQRAEHRDTQAIHAKLDELLRAEHRARSELMRIDEREPEVIQQHRAQERGNLPD